MKTPILHEIFTNVSNPGCAVLVHHLDTGTWSLFNCTASHLFVRTCSVNTDLIQ